MPTHEGGLTSLSAALGNIYCCHRYGWYR